MRMPANNNSAFYAGAVALCLLAAWGCADHQTMNPRGGSLPAAPAPLTEASASPSPATLTAMNFRYQDQKPVFEWEAPAHSPASFAILWCTDATHCADFVKVDCTSNPTNCALVDAAGSPLTASVAPLIDDSGATKRYHFELCDVSSLGISEEAGNFLRVEAVYQGQTGSPVDGSASTGLSESGACSTGASTTQ